MQIPEGYILISKVEYEQLLKKNEQLHKQIALLIDRVKDLEGMLHKDSHNSHKPPSSDVFRKHIKNSRIKGKRPQGCMVDLISVKNVNLIL
jgi:phage pi2 protein 07